MPKDYPTFNNATHPHVLASKLGRLNKQGVTIVAATGLLAEPFSRAVTYNWCSHTYVITHRRLQLHLVDDHPKLVTLLPDDIKPLPDPISTRVFTTMCHSIPYNRFLSKYLFLYNCRIYLSKLGVYFINK